MSSKADEGDEQNGKNIAEDENVPIVDHFLTQRTRRSKLETLNRKRFLKQSTTLAAGMMLAPSLLEAKAQEDILGHNNKRYRINTKWSQASEERKSIRL